MKKLFGILAAVPVLAAACCIGAFAAGTETIPVDYQISQAGTYVISGEVRDTTITVAAGDDDKVELILDNAVIENANGPAIYVQSADKVTITLKEGTTNTVADGADYEMMDGETLVDGAIFSRADLKIDGEGMLTVSGNCKHGIVSKDDLTIKGGTIQVTAQNVGLNGKDCVEIKGGAVTVTAGTDGIRSDNDEDSERGYVELTGGAVTITAGNDGIQAETYLTAAGADVAILAGGSGDTLTVADESSKGLKAGTDITISGGTIDIASLDDCVHANRSVTVTGGTLTLSSGDDGIHADNDLSVAGGEINILQSYEGLEGTRVLISDGKINLVAWDDGINAAGGNDGSALGGRPGQGSFAGGTGELVISGGYILVNAYGDGLDANGSITVSGGVTLVSGPTSSGNGALDYDATATVTGGVVVALGSAGMSQNFSAAENQGAILYTLGASQSAGTSFALCDENGDVIVSFTPEKEYQSAVVSAPEIQTGGTYTVVTGGTVSGADENGYAAGTDLTGGSEQGTVEMTGLLYGAGGGFGGMGGRGSRGGHGAW